MPRQKNAHGFKKKYVFLIMTSMVSCLTLRFYNLHQLEEIQEFQPDALCPLNARLYLMPVIRVIDRCIRLCFS